VARHYSWDRAAREHRGLYAGERSRPI
jgi:hypothetical protein